MFLAYLSLCPCPQPTWHPLHIVTGRSPPQRSRYLLEGATRQGSFRSLHARLQGTNFEFTSFEIRGNIEFSGSRKGRFGGLCGECAGIERFGAFPSCCGAILCSWVSGLALRSRVEGHYGQWRRRGTGRQKVRKVYDNEDQIWLLNYSAVALNVV